MRKIIILSLFIISFFTVYAQNTFTEAFDNIFQNISRVDASTGILYERVIPFARLQNYNSNIMSVDTSNSEHFIQAYFELYNAVFQPSAKLPFESDSLQSLSKKNSSIVDIGILHYKFNAIDSAVAYQKLYFDADSVLHENSAITASLYVERTAFVAAPLNKRVDVGTTTFRFNNLFRFDNTGNPIVELFVDFDDGFGIRQITDSLIIISYMSYGTKNLRFEALLQNGDTLIAYSTINCWSPDRANPKNKSGHPYIQKFEGSNAIKSKIILSNLYESGNLNFVEAKGEMWIYYSQSGNQLRRPILIVDGFDPENDRQFEWHKNEDKDSDALSIWGLLWYKDGNVDKHVGKQLLDRGYDLVILDLPDGGTYIERNAMVCIEVINRINQMLVTSGSQEEIIVVGPSMGGQITRYALAYMEKNPGPHTNNGKHNCRLWISFDSPHQGANISLGAQAFIHHFKAIQSSAKAVWDNTLNCIAAQQMLIHHKNSAAKSKYNTYYNALRNLGYPANLRKISVANGSLSNAANGVASATVFEMIFPWGIINIDSKIRMYPSKGQKTNVFSVLYRTFFIPVYWENETVNAPNDAPCSIDAAPGGYYNTFNIINKDAASWANMTVLYNAQHCFMPIPSVLDISDNSDYCTNFSNTDLVATGRTPFQSYWGSASANMDHVEFNQSLVNWLFDEIETYIQPGKRTLSFCDTAHYTIHFPAGKTSPVTWHTTNLEIISNQGSKIIVRPAGTGEGWVSATLTGNNILTHNKTLKGFTVNITYDEAVTNAPVLIMNNQTWNTPYIVNGYNMTITNGATLTVKSNIYMAQGAKITINPGAKLIIDGGTFTNACTGGMWEGIVASGGSIEIKNKGKIENAICGINVTNGGTVVTNTGAQFVNNTTHVNFGTQGLGTFTQTNFTSGSNCNPTNSNAQLKKNSSGEILVIGCFANPISCNIDNGMIVINRATTWSGNIQLLSVPVVIQAEGALTITGTINNDANTAITVHPAGKILVDGGTFKNTTGQMWQGITVLGDPEKPLNQNDQGYIEVKNGGRIENAVCGITVKGGGMVNAFSAYFTNNTLGVKFEPLASGQSGQSGSFISSRFETDHNYFGNTPEAHLKMDSSGNVSLSGCVFSSLVLNKIVVSNTSTTWSGNNYLAYTPVSLQSGATLYILNDIYSSEYTDITVSSSCKLIVNGLPYGSTLKNAHANKMWAGITILDGGYMELKNAKIENAVCGITVNEGGMVEVIDAHFINNILGVRFKPLTYQNIRRSGTFTRTSFILDNNYLSNPANFEGHLKMENCGEVWITECTFSTLTSANANNGIIASNASKWTGNNQLLSVPVDLQSRATLTNTDTISSDMNTTITVSPGAKIVIDGGIFKNVTGRLWQGITVLGNPRQSMMDGAQGVIELKNGGKIENAKCGITVKGGGMVYATEAHFINNTVGV
ncbi:MAG: alpha/beta hydrolase, partial [Bacteroidetes bacterium]|nr:alpha/beta hydrolase [Bacteroidota bacterium]MCL2302654.1 alpha/beta hydrolase [Lentimicrobiaceae bacterium]